jgi:hypothetical protein
LRCCRIAADRPGQSAAVVLARRRRACLLASSSEQRAGDPGWDGDAAASRRIALDNPLPSSLLGDEERVSSFVVRAAAGDPGYPVAAVGLRMAACLWQALPKKFTRTEFIASVLAGAGRKEAPRRDERDTFSP